MIRQEHVDLLSRRNRRKKEKERKKKTQKKTKNIQKICKKVKKNYTVNKNICSHRFRKFPYMKRRVCDSFCGGEGCEN